MRVCSHDSCKIRPSFNVKGSKKALYCKKHAEEGMVDVLTRRCLHDPCTRTLSFTCEGRKMAKYCKQHAEDGMITVFSRCSSHDSCTKAPSFNAEGRKTAEYCKQHAEDGMVNVYNRRCSHDSCIRLPSWGVLTRGIATVCVRHKSDMLGSEVVNFRVICYVAGCRRESRWALSGEQPSHCRDHGPAEDGLVCTVPVGKTSLSRLAAGLPYRAARGSSLHVKTECLF